MHNTSSYIIHHTSYSLIIVERSCCNSVRSGCGDGPILCGPKSTSMRRIAIVHLLLNSKYFLKIEIFEKYFFNSLYF